MKTLELKKDFYWAGVLDPKLRVFDIIMETEFGTTYNSYVIKGSEKTAIFETAKAKCKDEYLSDLKRLVDINDIDYIIVNHTEPDHAGTAVELIKENPSIRIVGTATAISFMKEITNIDFTSIVVKEGDSISLGNKTLKFIAAPNLHWPDSMYTYIEEDKTLVTCDSFGCHYSFDEILISKMKDWEGYYRALQYYFDNIMGPFKSYVLQAINKIKELDIDMICPGHGPVLDKEPWKIVEQYKEWSTVINPNEKKTVVIPYVAAYGYTKDLLEKITEGINAAGDIDIRAYDMVESEQGKVLEELAFADGILFGTPTILGDGLKPIWDLTTSIFPITHGGKIASAFGSYGWSGEGVPNIVARLKQLRMKVYGDGLRVRFKPSKVQLEEAYEFGYGFGQSVIQGKVLDPKDVVTGKKAWKCLVCGEVIEGLEAPEACPVCGVGPEQFVPVEIEDVTYKSEAREEIIVIGGGVAALSACEEIRKRNSVCNIEMISAEEVFTYNRPMLTKGILSEIEPINFFNRDLNWYKEKNIKLTLGTEVTKINKDKKEITLNNGEHKKYDKLIYATGAECNRPPIKGSDREGVFVIRKLQDANRLRESLPKANSVAVIGGGILGLEAAWEFKKAGKKVSIIERSAGLMSNQLDEKASQLLRDAAEKIGISVITEAIIKEIDQEGVVLEDGTKALGNIVVISAGIKPNSELGVKAGLDGDRWIEVNSKMETSDENIYACGDVAAISGKSIGIWAQATDMGKVAGANAAGDSVEYKGVIPSNSFKGFETELFAIGDAGKNKDLHYKIIEIEEPAKGLYKKMYFVNNKFVGGILLGDVKESPKFLEAFKEKMAQKDLLKLM